MAQIYDFIDQNLKNIQKYFYFFYYYFKYVFFSQLYNAFL